MSQDSRGWGGGLLLAASVTQSYLESQIEGRDSDQALGKGYDCTGVHTWSTHSWSTETDGAVLMAPHGEGATGRTLHHLLLETSCSTSVLIPGTSGRSDTKKPGFI